MMHDALRGDISAAAVPDPLDRRTVTGRRGNRQVRFRPLFFRPRRPFPAGDCQKRIPGGSGICGLAAVLASLNEPLAAYIKEAE